MFCQNMSKSVSKQIDSDKTARRQYTYDKLGSSVRKKNCLKEKNKMLKNKKVVIAVIALIFIMLAIVGYLKKDEIKLSMEQGIKKF